MFKGDLTPTKKYALGERISLPCEAKLTLQKWSFNLRQEQLLLKTDSSAFKLIAMQMMHRIDTDNLRLDEGEREELQKTFDPGFPCFQQFVSRYHNVIFFTSAPLKNDTPIWLALYYLLSIRVDFSISSSLLMVVG